MGVDYYVCDHCGKTFPDCMGYDRCEAGHRICDKCTRHILPREHGDDTDKYDGLTEDGELPSVRCPVCILGGTAEEIYLGALRKIVSCRGPDRASLGCYMIGLALDAIARGSK